MRRIAAVVGILVSTSCGFAADNSLERSPFFVEVSTGGAFSNWLIYSIGTRAPDNPFETQPVYFVDQRFAGPVANAGSKIAFQSSGSPLGAQLDFDIEGYSYDWLAPSFFSDGYSYSISSLGHVSYLMNQATKYGAYFGFLRRGSAYLNESFEDRFSSDALVYGIEALHTFGQATWVEGHVGIVDDIASRFSTNGFSTTFSGRGIYSIDAGAALHHRFSPQWSASAGLNLNRYSRDDFTRLNWHLEGGVQYDFQAVPLKLLTTVAYFRSDFEEAFFPALHDRYAVKAQLTWSFGERDNGAGGKLFSGLRMLGSAN
jgi:hypothetical protein